MSPYEEIQMVCVIVIFLCGVILASYLLKYLDPTTDRSNKP